MSKMFSVVTLDASHSLMTEHFVPGSPDGLDELLNCDEISEVLAEWPLGDTIEAKIQTYLYGDGKPCALTRRIWLSSESILTSWTPATPWTASQTTAFLLNRASWILGAAKKAKMRKIWNCKTRLC